MTDLNCMGKFIYQKVSCVKLRPAPSGSGQTVEGKFITGSWEDENNSIKLWSFDPNDASVEPQLLAKLPNSGDVNQIEFIDRNNFCVASSDGLVRAVSIINDKESTWDLVESRQWKSNQADHFSSSCTGISVFDDQVASSSSDGTVSVVNVRSGRTEKLYKNQDKCSLSAIKFINNDELIVSNIRGQIQLFDLRTNAEGATSTFSSSAKDQVGINCLAKHPGQAHIICSGCQQGSLTFWDLRTTKQPVTILAGHDQAVNAVQFHPTQPEHVFSCSENGDVWQWHANKSRSLNFETNRLGSKLPNSTGLESCWFINEAVKHRLESISLMPRQSLPVNSLDVRGTVALVGADNEAFYLLHNLSL